MSLYIAALNTVIKVNLKNSFVLSFIAAARVEE
jgi:hypothetical protein